MGKSIRSKRGRKNRAALRKQIYDWEVDSRGEVIEKPKKEISMEESESHANEESKDTILEDADGIEEKIESMEDQDTESKVSSQIQRKLLRSRQRWRIRHSRRHKKRGKK